MGWDSFIYSPAANSMAAITLMSVTTTLWCHPKSVANLEAFAGAIPVCFVTRVTRLAGATIG